MSPKKVEVNPETDAKFGKELGERLRILRGTHSQADFARNLGVAVNSIGRYERGENFPDAGFLRRLHELTGADVSELLGLPSKSVEALKLATQTGHPMPEDWELFVGSVQALCRREEFLGAPAKAITLLARGLYEMCRETGKTPDQVIGEYLPS